MATAKLLISGLGKTFHTDRGETVALKGVDLGVGDNEFVALVGTSGCGKSTLLSIAAGLEIHDEGTISIDDEAIVAPGLDRGVVFQSYTLLPWLTTLGNVEFALKAAGKSSREARDIAPSYVRTLAAWRERFLANADAVRALGFDERFIRMWEYYLALSQAGFATGLSQDHQIVLEKGRGLAPEA